MNKTFFVNKIIFMFVKMKMSSLLNNKNSLLNYLPNYIKINLSFLIFNINEKFFILASIKIQTCEPIKNVS